MTKVIITRPIEFALPLQAALSAQNIDSFVFPTLDIQAIPFEKPQEPIDYWLYISRNAVTYGNTLLQQGSQTLAIGKGTYDALKKQGYPPVIEPQKPYNSEQFLQHPALPINSDRHVAIIKGTGGRNLLYQELKKRAASVLSIDVYKRHISRPNQQKLHDYMDIIEQEQAYIFINSIETLTNLLTLTPSEAKNTLLNQRLITGSTRVVKAARQAGFSQLAQQAVSTTDKDMIDCLLKNQSTNN